MRAFLSLAALFLTIVAVEGRAQTVRNPDASFLDVAARREELRDPANPRLRAAMAAVAPCPAQTLAPPRGRAGAADRAYEAMEWAVASAATRHVATGDLAEARCVLDILGAWAAADAMLGYSREESLPAWFNVGKAASAAALALSVVRGSATLDQAKLHATTEWLVRVAEHHLAQLPDQPGPEDTWVRDHHAYWRGLMATAVGVVARNGELFRLGLRTFGAAIADLDDTGRWPLETARGVQGQNLALQPLILIAELAGRQGVDLYGQQADGRSLHDAVRALLETPDAQFDEVLKPGTADLAWAEFYVRQRPDSAAKRLLTAPLFNRWLGGGATVYVASPR